jgi:hypothetical protein
MGAPPSPEEADRRLGARYPQWADMRVRLQHRWTPAHVLIWHARAFPAEPRPSQRTLYRFLESQPKEWFVSPLVVAGGWQKRLPLVLVLERQAEALEALAMRIGRALGQEEKLQGFMLPEVRENLALYFKALQAHFQTQQEMGLVPALPKRLDIREEKHELFHHLFEFLEPDEAFRLKELEARAQKGEFNVLELYQSMAGVFQAEQKAQGEEGH